jgi:hypothetical protein
MCTHPLTHSHLSHLSHRLYSKATNKEQKKYALTAMNVCIDAYEDQVPLKLVRCIVKYLLLQSNKKASSSSVSELVNELLSRCETYLADPIYDLFHKGLRIDPKLRTLIGHDDEFQHDDEHDEDADDDDDDGTDKPFLHSLIQARHGLYERLGLVAPAILYKLVPLIELELAVCQLLMALLRPLTPTLTTAILTKNPPDAICRPQIVVFEVMQCSVC